MKIDGIEIFPNYIKEYHEYFYDNIIIQDAFKYIKEMGKEYDLIILGDVLEHFEKDTAINLLSVCIEKSKFVLLNIPIGKYWKQTAKNGNKFEEHLSFWNSWD